MQRTTRLALFLAVLLLPGLFMMLRLPEPEPTLMSAGAATPQRIGDQSLNGRGVFLVESGRTYLLAARCRLGQENAAAIDAGKLDASQVSIATAENTLRKEGVRAELTGADIRKVMYRVWAVHGGGIVNLHGLTAPLVGKLSRHEVVERYNRRVERDRRNYSRRVMRKDESLQPADLYQDDVAVWELHADVLLYIPTDLPPPLGRFVPLLEIDPSIRTARYGGGSIEFKLDTLPEEEKLRVTFDASDEGRYVVWIPEDGGAC